MSSVVSGVVNQIDLAGLRYQFTDTGSYTAPVTIRVLNVYDSNGALLDTFNMGASLTQEIDVTADSYLSFNLNITDATGELPTYIYNYLTTGIYKASYLSRMASLGCKCDNIPGQVYIAEEYVKTSYRYLIGGQGEASQLAINAANTYINIY